MTGALESALLALGPWGIAAVVAFYTFRAMSNAVTKRSDTVRGLLEERTKEVTELKEERRKLQAENARLEEALDNERDKRRRAEDECAELRRAATYQRAGQANPQDPAMGSIDPYRGAAHRRSDSPADSEPRNYR